MRLYTAITDNGYELFAGVDGVSAYRLSDFGYDFKDMTELICSISEDGENGIEELCRKIKGTHTKEYSVEKLKLMAPVVTPRQDIICLGLNYDEHIEEAGRFSKEAFGGEKPYTIYFSKRVTRATATNENIPSYKGMVEKLDYEVELGVVLGKDALFVKAEDAMEYIFGYTIINDISARDLQTRHKQWYRGKSLDGFTPMGPCIVTKDEILDVNNLNVRSFVNGELRQNSNTKYMIQSVAKAIEELSCGMTLAAGTIIATGTPAGVGMGMIPPTFLKEGDTVVCEIEKIGSITNTVG